MPEIDRLIQDITQFIFLEDEPIPADIILVAGSSDSLLAVRAAELFRAGFAPRIVVSGRYAAVSEALVLNPRDAERYPGTYPTEAAFLSAIMESQGVPPGAILKENQARRTQQNAIFSRQLLEAQGITPRTAILVSKPAHARRAYTYYQIAFPGTHFAVCPTQDPDFTRHSWPHNPQQFARVMRELAKCGNQTVEDLRQALGLPPLS